VFQITVNIVKKVQTPYHNTRFGLILQEVLIISRFVWLLGFYFDHFVLFTVTPIASRQSILKKCINKQCHTKVKSSTMGSHANSFLDKSAESKI